jgi:hypothetical protein
MNKFIKGALTGIMMITSSPAYADNTEQDVYTVIAAQDGKIVEHGSFDDIIDCDKHKLKLKDHIASRLSDILDTRIQNEQPFSSKELDGLNELKNSAESMQCIVK